jgi:AcrR family transcriptional regulator
MMARPPPPERLASVAAAATELFGQLGYRRTQMADVARKAGLSTGAIYTYVESKEALFHVVFAVAFGQFAEAAPSLPVATPARTATLKLVGTGLARAGATPLLQSALSIDRPADIRLELTGIVEERCALIERLWPVLAVIERSAVDLPDLDALYYDRRRRGYIDQLEQYLAKRGADGYLRTTPDVRVAGQVVTEMIAWSGWHRREDRRAALFDTDLTRNTIVQLICDALIEPVR